MNKNLLLFLFALCITLFIVDVKPASAIVLVKKEGSAILSGPTYNSARDAYVVVFDKSVVTHNMHRHYTDESLSRVGYENYVTIEPSWTGEQYLNCKRWTEEIYYDSSGSVVGHLIFYADELKTDSCKSNYNDPSKEGTSSVDCGEAVCKCIFEVETAVGEVNKSVNANGEKLSDINASINVGNGIMGDIAKQVTTGKSIVDAPDTSIKQPTVKPVSGLPDVPDAFEDNETRFKDEGNASESPGALPESPEIAECWDKTDDVTCKQDKGTPEEELKKDNQQTKEEEIKKDNQLEKDTFDSDRELEKDSFSKDNELEKDSFIRDLPMEKDRDMTSDSYQRDSQMEKENFEVDAPMEKDSFGKTEEYDKNSELGRTNFYERTEN